MAKKKQNLDKESEQRPHDAMVDALLALRHAAEAATPPHYRTPAWKQAIAKADEAINAHFTPPTGD